MTVAGVNMISQSCEIDHSECHCDSGRQKVSQICQARSPDKDLGATDPRAPVSRERCSLLLVLSFVVLRTLMPPPTHDRFLCWPHD